MHDTLQGEVYGRDRAKVPLEQMPVMPTELLGPAEGTAEDLQPHDLQNDLPPESAGYESRPGVTDFQEDHPECRPGDEKQDRGTAYLNEQEEQQQWQRCGGPHSGVLQQDRHPVSDGDGRVRASGGGHRVQQRCRSPPARGGGGGRGASKGGLKDTFLTSIAAKSAPRPEFDPAEPDCRLLDRTCQPSTPPWEFRFEAGLDGPVSGPEIQRLKEEVSSELQSLGEEGRRGQEGLRGTKRPRYGDGGAVDERAPVSGLRKASEWTERFGPGGKALPMDPFYCLEDG